MQSARERRRASRADRLQRMRQQEEAPARGPNGPSMHAGGLAPPGTCVRVGARGTEPPCAGPARELSEFRSDR